MRVARIETTCETDIVQLPEITDVLARARVVALPMRTRFRGLTEREAVLIEGPRGWTEFSPFVEYDDAECANWLRATYEFGWDELPTPIRASVGVNATLPAVSVSEVEAVLASFGACRTIKVKVAEAGQTLNEDVARVREARRVLGPEGRIRVDANGGWNVDEAEHAIHALAECDLEYVEQPCASVNELAEIRKRVKYMGIPIAADESVRKADDPLAVARAGAADLVVVKAQPLGGIRRALDIVAEAGLPAVVSSALDTSIGIAMGLALAARLPQLEYDCGLGTAALLVADVVDEPLIPVAGELAVTRPAASAKLLDTHTASAERTQWWLDRLARVHRLLAD